MKIFINFAKFLSLVSLDVSNIRKLCVLLTNVKIYVLLKRENIRVNELTCTQKHDQCSQNRFHHIVCN